MHLTHRIGPQKRAQAFRPALEGRCCGQRTCGNSTNGRYGKTWEAGRMIGSTHCAVKQVIPPFSLPPTSATTAAAKTSLQKLRVYMRYIGPIRYVACRVHEGRKGVQPEGRQEFQRGRRIPGRSVADHGFQRSSRDTGGGGARRVAPGSGGFEGSLTAPFAQATLVSFVAALGEVVSCGGLGACTLSHAPAGCRIFGLFRAHTKYHAKTRARWPRFRAHR